MAEPASPSRSRSSVGLAAWLLLAPSLGAAPAQNAVEETAAAFEAGELGRALELADEIEDPGLAAEWRFHVLHSGGDLQGALAAARAGLERAPENAALLENGARCALALGLGATAQRLAEALVEAASEGSLETARRARELARLAAERAALEGRAERAAGLARATALGLFALCLGLLAWLARPGV